MKLDAELCGTKTRSRPRNSTELQGRQREKARSSKRILTEI